MEEMIRRFLEFFIFGYECSTDSLEPKREITPPPCFDYLFHVVPHTPTLRSTF